MCTKTEMLYGKPDLSRKDSTVKKTGVHLSQILYLQSQTQTFNEVIFQTNYVRSQQKDRLRCHLSSLLFPHKTSKSIL